jgi:hypothetical protein
MLVPAFLSSRWFALLSLLLLLAAAELVYLSAEHYTTGGYGFSLDDSWIHATFARNLATGNGYAFHPHETISASTAPLYTALLAGWYLIAHEVVWGAKLMGILGLALAGLFLFLATERLSDRLTAWLAVALCFLSPALLIASLSGMEIGLYLVSPCAALYAFTRQRYGWMIFALALGVWMRPEALLLLGIGWLAVPKEKKLVTLGIGAAIVLPYFIFNYALSGYPLPLTVRTKAKIYSGHFSTYFLSEISTLFTQYHWLPLFALVPLGFVALWKKAWWVAGFPLAFLLMEWGTNLGTASFHRYVHPMLPFTYVLMAFGASWIAARLPRYRVWVWVGITLLLVMQAQTAYKLRWTHALAVQNITDMQITIANLAANTTDPGDLVATNDVGAVGYFSGRYVLDLMGLVSPLKNMGDNLREGRPVLLAIFDPWFIERKTDSTFINHYKFLGALKLKQNVVCGYEVMSVYARDDKFDLVKQRMQQMQELQEHKE